MTQEQKARAYDEALERARKINSGEGVDASPDWTVCEVIFPELKEESEDERIRQEIIDSIKRSMESMSDTTKATYSSWLAWLEKQEYAITCSEEQMKVLDEVLNFAANHESPYWNDYIFGTLNSLIRQLKKMPCDAYIAGNDDKDEEIRKALINIFATHKDYEMFFGVSVEDILAWLKKQKTKKSEWLFEKGKWYVKLQHHYEGDLRHFEKGHVYQALSEVKITDGYHNVSLGSWEIPKYFRPANQNEIPEELKKTKLDENEEIRNYFINAINEQPNIHQEWKEKCLAWIKTKEEN